MDEKKVKALAWIASSKKDLMEFSHDVRKEMDLLESRLKGAKQKYKEWLSSQKQQE